jgi:hypothetical protein
VHEKSTVAACGAEIFVTLTQLITQEPLKLGAGETTETLTGETAAFATSAPKETARDIRIENLRGMKLLIACKNETPRTVSAYG